MRALGNLLLIVSLTVGALAASSAYLAPLSLPVEKLEGLTLNADAGFAVDETGAIELDEQGHPKPLFKKGVTLDRTMALQLKTQAENDQLQFKGRRVRSILVQQFDLARWPGKWFFLLACAGLVGGAFLVRKGARAQIQAAAAKAQEGGSPEEIIQSALQVVRELLPALQALPDDDARCAMIVERIGQLQRNEMELFAEKREELIGRFSLAGFAAIMDRFAAAERQVNRAWSTAADGVCDEALACLERAGHAFEETLERLGARSTIAGDLPAPSNVIKRP